MKRLLLATLLGLALLAGLSIPAQEEPKYTRTEDVIYGRKFGTALTLDVFEPEKKNGAAIFFMVGGGFFSDHKNINLYYPKTRPTLKNCGSRGFLIVVIEHPAKFFSALDVAHLGQRRRRLDQFVLDPLMIAPLAIIIDESRDGGPQMLLA